MKNIFNTDLNKNDINKNVVLYGWVKKTRNLGGMIFIDLRDRSGVIQLVCKPENSKYSAIKSLKNESVIKVSGLVAKKDNENKNLKTGDIEIIIEDIEVLNTSEDLPFEITDDSSSFEDTRLKYRYLDLRRKTLSDKIITRSKIMSCTRDYFTKNKFFEIETPIFCKSTPEGARDYLVPSRVNNGKFYALPQSPQIFKQLLMVSGFERYFQIAKCFRDEDLRSDRQPEFTQIDLEMSFVNQEDIISMTEGYIKKIFKEIKNIDIDIPIKKMTYKDAIDKYGSDKPDLRFGMEILDLESLKTSSFETFKYSDSVNGILVKNVAKEFSRKNIDELNENAKKEGLSGLFVLKYEDGFTGSINKFITDDIKDKLIKDLDICNQDVLIITCGEYNQTKK
jgi:aspartyl-tRNA synthetase